jgi:putative cell wall-binding protein
MDDNMTNTMKKDNSADFNSLGATERQSLDIVQEEVGIDTYNEALNASKVAQALETENKKLQEQNDQLKYRFNLMYLVMQSVWERLGYKSGTWEQKLDKVRSWAKEPERAFAKKIMDVANNKKRTSKEDDDGPNGLEYT